jgi:hypothetical protein
MFDRAAQHFGELVTGREIELARKRDALVERRRFVGSPAYQCQHGTILPAQSSGVITPEGVLGNLLRN